MKTNKNLIYIAGPTGVGKTAFSIELAKKLKTEIISCDSRQFYKELEIGTCPPTKHQLKEIKHHFIHNKSIHDKYNVGLYEKDAIHIINNLFEDKEYLILVGGSGLYADSVIYGIDEFPEIPEKIRDEITREYKDKGISYLQEELKKLDKEYYKIVDIKNQSRIIRALEIIKFTGSKFSSLRKHTEKKREFKTKVVLLECSREVLYDKINRRVDVMISNGLEEEAFKLRKHSNLNTLNTVGYKEFFDYFENKLSYDEAIDKIKQNTRNYAKRQITWLKKYKNSKKINIEKINEIDLNKII
jgi:tRNA dimethylallyltransferase